MQTHIHPRSKVELRGIRLVPGAILQKQDRYDSTCGKWEDCTVVGGTVPKGDHVIWVRPGDISQDAKNLLGFLTAYRGDFYSHITRYSYGFVVIPTRDWSPFTATMNLATPTVKCPECVQELIDYGFLSIGPDVHSVTEAGRAKVREF